MTMLGFFCAARHVHHKSLPPLPLGLDYAPCAPRSKLPSATREPLRDGRRQTLVLRGMVRRIFTRAAAWIGKEST